MPSELARMNITGWDAQTRRIMRRALLSYSKSDPAEVALIDQYVALIDEVAKAEGDDDGD